MEGFGRAQGPAGALGVLEIAKMKPKAIACLELVELPHAPFALRREKFAALAALYSEKAVERKLYELVDRGYIEFGTMARGGWLTAKGKAALAGARNIPALTASTESIEG